MFDEKIITFEGKLYACHEIDLETLRGMKRNAEQILENINVEKPKIEARIALLDDEISKRV